MLRHASVAALVCLSLVSCKKDDDNASGSANGVVATASAGLLFTGNNSTTFPWASSLYRMDPDTFEIEKLLDFQSSDAVVYKANPEVLLFNRATGQQSFRVFTPSADKKTLTKGDELAFTAGGEGDPHDVVDLGNNVILLANYNDHKLSLMNKTTGAKISDVSADWDLPAGSRFSPDSLFKKIVGTITYIYVVHQAGAFEGSNYTVDGSQTVFVLTQIGQSVFPIDLDPVTPKVQGIKVKGSFPTPIKTASESNALLLMSTCSRFVVASATHGECHAGIEQINTLNNTAMELWNLDGRGYYNNGGAISTGDDTKVLAQIDQKVGDVYTKRIMKFDAIAKIATSVYEYEAASGGYFGFFYDAFRGNLLIGDVNTDTVGKFTIVKADGSKVVKAFDGIPYSGTFIY
ncbi:MAG: hypothetical protein H7249_08220 [Chitinophagaceae bacterium]|nr:hypothetical protein [Oligoflexus sp.]